MLATAILLCLAPGPADRVLVVANADSPTSLEIADVYMKRRGVKNLVKVSCPDSASAPASETIAFAAYREKIEAPVRAALAKLPGVDFVVLTKGVPIRVTGADTGIGDGRASVDSCLASLDYRERKDARRLVLDESGFKGRCWVNNFWNSKEPFRHSKFGGYLVTRLDGYTVEQVKAMIGSSLAAAGGKPTGRILLDVAAGHGVGDAAKVPLPPSAPNGATMVDMGYKDWDADLLAAGKHLEKRGVPVLLDVTEEFVGRKGGLMGYASWGSNDPKFNAEHYRLLSFAPGGIAETAVSTSARTFLPTSGGQSLIADLKNATGAKGYSDEPLLQAVASPLVLFDRYTSGWTLAESFYAASRYVGWQDIVVGDPLCAPYAR